MLRIACIRPCPPIYHPLVPVFSAARSGNQATETTEPGARARTGDERSRSREEHDQPRESRRRKKEQATAGLTGERKKQPTAGLAGAAASS